MHRVIQFRWIRGSDQNFPNEVWSGTRRKDAYGQAKHNLDSHLEMLLNHEHFDDFDVEIDTDSYMASFYDEEGLYYRIAYIVWIEG